MQLDITLPSSGTKKVELHYEKLEKHCFLCHSLSHEESECSQRNAPAVNRTSSRGINHAQTIESLESYRRARDDRKIERGRFVEASRREADYHRRRSDIHQRTQVNHRRSPPRVANHNDQMRGSSAASLGTRITARNPQNTTASPRLSASQRISHGQPSAHSRLGERVWVEKGSQAQYSHTPPPNPPREAMYANQEVDSTQNRRQIAHRLQLSDERGVLPPVGDLDSSSQERRSVLHRIETTGTRALTPVPSGHAMAAQERLPALQRLAPSPTERVPLLRNGVANSNSGRLQDVAVHYLEDTFPLTLLEGSGKPSSSRVPAVERLSRPQISPIRGLSEDRRQVEHTRDAPQQSEDGDPSYLPPATTGTSSRKGKGVVLTSNGKGKIAENDLPQPRKRTTRTPLQGVSLKKRRVTKTVHSPKRRPTTGNTQPAKGSRGVEILDSSPNLIDVKIVTGSEPTFITFIYGVPRPEERANLWEKLTSLGTVRDDAWLVTGDFNDLLDSSEKIGGLERWEGSFVAFRSFVTQAGLWDLQHTGNHLSWRGIRYNHFIQSRIDRAMANCRWSENFLSSYCEYLSFEGLDHRPLMTYLDNKQRKKRNLFRYDRRLTSKPEVKELVQANWNLQSNDSRALEETLSSSSPDTDLIEMLTNELDKAYVEEERYWRQRSRILWLQSGDMNTSYFHAITRGRKAANKFAVIEKQDGCVVFEEKQIAEAIAEYYRNLFTSSSDGNAQIVWSDPWLSTQKPLIPIGPPTVENQHLVVADLLDANTKEWNLDAVRLHLPQYEDMIKCLIPSEFLMDDEIAWLPERSGTYSTKTGYRLCKVNQGHEDPNFNWNLCVWQVKTSPKLKQFLWKINSNALPVGANLLRRGIEVEGLCKRCGIVETERHLFLQCPYALRVWELVPALIKPDPGTITSSALLLQACRRTVNLPPTGLSETALYSWILWYLWVSRNKLIFENREMQELEVVSLALKEARIWQSAQQNKEKPSPSQKLQVPLACGTIDVLLNHKFTIYNSFFFFDEILNLFIHISYFRNGSGTDLGSNPDLG
ncbi:hypothetical protein Bca52824_048490 [Brassica carinata]|uniref:Reverse transcriptase zinc-binding domain-containing protein n=1 Tax=Brassica carinata TaxID=52824 RepID=A0A8X7UTA3_BRACI|nr:hypothetical protein Bca52824_048490 [Brassica carinata]